MRGLRPAAVFLLVVGLGLFGAGAVAYMGVRQPFDQGLARTRALEGQTAELDKMLREPLSKQNDYLLKPDLDKRWEAVGPVRESVQALAALQASVRARQAKVPGAYQEKRPFQEAEAKFKQEAEEFANRFQGILDQLAKTLRKFDRFHFGRSRVAPAARAMDADHWADLRGPDGPIPFDERPRVFVLGTAEGDFDWRTAVASVVPVSKAKTEWIFRVIASRSLHKAGSEREIGILWFATGTRQDEAARRPGAEPGPAAP